MSVSFPEKPTREELLEFLLKHNSTEELAYLIRLHENKDKKFRFVRTVIKWGVTEIPTLELGKAMERVLNVIMMHRREGGLLQELSVIDMSQEIHFCQFNHRNAMTISDVIGKQTLLKFKSLESSAHELFVKDKKRPLAMFMSWIHPLRVAEFILLIKSVRPLVVFIVGDARGPNWDGVEENYANEMQTNLSDGLVYHGYDKKRLAPGQICRFDYFLRDSMRDYGRPESVCSTRSVLDVYYLHALSGILESSLGLSEGKRSGGEICYSFSWFCPSFIADGGPTLGRKELTKTPKKARWAKDEPVYLKCGTHIPRLLQAQDGLEFMFIGKHWEKAHSDIDKMYSDGSSIVAKNLKDFVRVPGVLSCESKVALPLEVLNVWVLLEISGEEETSKNGERFAMVERCISSARSKETKQCRTCGIVERPGRSMIDSSDYYCSLFCKQKK